MAGLLRLLTRLEFDMKKQLVTLIGSPTFAAALSACVSSSGISGASGECRAVPLLDHGPRAQTTPYQNQLRKERQPQACGGTTK